MKEKTCWKSSSGRCIDLIISNRKFSLMNTGTVETGLSDHHLLIYTMLKTTFQKLAPKVVKYRKYKNFDINVFKNELSHYLHYNIVDYGHFEEIFTSILEKHAPMKTKFLRGNNQPHLSKTLRKAIMKRSKLKRIANRSKNPEDMVAYQKQRNLVVNLNRQAKKDYIANSSTSTQGFWKTIKPFFSSKGSICDERILLVDNGKVVSNEEKISSIFNLYFNRITDDLEIPEIPKSLALSPDPVSTAIAKYANHPSILAIKSRQNSVEFELHTVTTDTMIKEILSLNSSKTVSGSIPIKVLQLAAHECANVLTMCFNKYIVNLSSFPDELKLADIVPIHKKGNTSKKANKSDKANYRPISLLPTVSKVFERLITKQIEPFTNNWLSKYLCGFRKGYSCQYSILNMLRKWQSCLNTSGKVGAILMDLSKAFDCLPHDLLIAKLAAYGFGQKSLKLFMSYLSDRKHRVRIGSSVSEFLTILLGVPQGSVLGPILFNIFVNDLLFAVNEASICNFADDNTLYVCDQDITNVLRRLKKDLDVVVNWFSSNGMVANPDKFKVIFPGSQNVISINIGPLQLKSTEEVILLGVKIDSQLSFYPHIKDICKKASAKTKALMRIRRYLTQKQVDRLYTAHVMSPFNYCPLVWMFCSKQAHNLIDSTHRRALCAKLNTFTGTLDELLQKSNTISIHTKNLQLLLIEIFKSVNHLNPEFMWDSFIMKPDLYNLRQGSSIVVPRATSTRATNSFDVRAALAWNHLTSSIKSEITLTKFKSEIKKHRIYCRCKRCLYMFS